MWAPPVSQTPVIQVVIEVFPRKALIEKTIVVHSELKGHGVAVCIPGRNKLVFSFSPQKTTGRNSCCLRNISTACHPASDLTAIAIVFASASSTMQLQKRSFTPYWN